MSTGDTTLNPRADPTTRVGQVDWPTLVREVNSYGCALTPQILSRPECTSISGLYDETEQFRSTIAMARYRFGSGQYRYFRNPLLELVARLRDAFSPHPSPW